MKKFIHIVSAVAVAGSLFVPVMLFAQTATSTPPFRQGIREERKEMHEDIKERRMEIRDTTHERLEDVREEMYSRIRTLRGTATTTPAIRHEVIRETIDEMRERVQEVRGEAKEKRDELREEIRERREEIRLRVAEEVAKRVRAHFDKMLKRFDAAIDRLEKLADRIESRLDKAADNGKDVTALRAKLTISRGKIAEAEIVLDDATAKFEEILGMDNPREAFKEVQELMRGVKEKIKEAHRALVDVINSLKGTGNTATTTPSGTATTTPAVLP